MASGRKQKSIDDLWAEVRAARAAEEAALAAQQAEQSQRVAARSAQWGGAYAQEPQRKGR